MRTRVWIALLVAALGWGSGGVATRAALDQGFEPVVTAGLRAVVAVGAVTVYLVASGRRPPTDRAVWRAGIVLGTTNLAIPFVLVTLAVQYASAGFVGLIITNLAVGTALWSHVMLPTERLHVRKFVGLGVAATGVVVLVASGDSGLASGGRPLLAIGLTLISLTVDSFGVVYAKRLEGPIDTAALTFSQLVVGSIVIAIIVPVTDGLPEATTAGWLLVLYMGIASTALPFLLFYWALRHAPATIVALVGYLIPIVSLVLGVLLLDEQITIALAVGGALILGGVVLTERIEASRARTTLAPGSPVVDLHSPPQPTTDPT